MRTVELAKSCDYAIRGLLYLAERDDPFTPVLLRDIARRSNAPEAFLSKLFQNLRASNLVRSHRGRTRGYSLARPAKDISLYDIIVATEGPGIVRSMRTRPASAKAEEAFRRAWAQIEDQMVSTLKNTTLQAILSREIEGKA